MIERGLVAVEANGRIYAPEDVTLIYEEDPMSEILMSEDLNSLEAGMLLVLIREELARHRFPPHALLSARDKLLALETANPRPEGRGA
jgi:hypothetical protein